MSQEINFSLPDIWLNKTVWNDTKYDIVLFPTLNGMVLRRNLNVESSWFSALFCLSSCFPLCVEGTRVWEKRERKEQENRSAKTRTRTNRYVTHMQRGFSSAAGFYKGVRTEKVGLRTKPWAKRRKSPCVPVSGRRPTVERGYSPTSRRRTRASWARRSPRASCPRPPSSPPSLQTHAHHSECMKRGLADMGPKGSWVWNGWRAVSRGQCASHLLENVSSRLSAVPCQKGTSAKNTAKHLNREKSVIFSLPLYFNRQGCSQNESHYFVPCFYEVRIVKCPVNFLLRCLWKRRSSIGCHPFV